MIAPGLISALIGLLQRRCRVGHKDAKGKGYSIFRSAAEEAEMRGRDARQRAGEGGHMSCTRGRIVSSPGLGCHSQL